MKKVLLRAPLLTNSGYGVHSRQIFEWLDAKNDIDLTVECLNWGKTSWFLKGEREDGLIQRIMSRSKKNKGIYDVTFQLQLPDEWDPNLGKFNIGMSAFVETDRCNPAWIDRCNQMDLIVVPSSFTKSIVEKSGIVLKEIKVIPEYFNQKILNKNSTTSFEKIKTRFNFLMMAQLTDVNPENDRKNILNTIKTFCETFENNKDVGLILKTSAGKYSQEDKKITVEVMKNLLSQVRKSNFPKVHLLHGDMSSKEIADLYNSKKVHAFLSATRGEGYGIPLVDAAAAGIPVIATNWSGHLDFLKDDFVKVDYSLVDISENKIDNRIFFKNFKWANPCNKSLSNNLIRVCEKYDYYKKVAEKNQTNVLKNFGKERIFNMYESIWREVIND